MAQMPDVVAAGPIELRRWSIEVLDDLMRAVESSQPELARWMPWADPMPSREAELAAIRSGVKDFEDGVAFHYFMVEAASGELVGAASLLPTDEGPTVMQIGYWVRTDRTGRGYATASAAALTDAAFDVLGLSAVDIRMDQGNHASAAVPSKLGFVLHREQQRDRLAPGHTGAGYIWRRTPDPIP